MSYQVLARKWRPRSFRELVGQQHVLQALVNALDHDRLHHAYLFTGTRGVGKTTIARILARCLNCEIGVSSEPCGQCSACNEINEGRFVDLIEVDAASRTKVEDTRELLENVQYAPTRGRYKVYLIDEVHMLSSHSFNALLKTLEEPPPHVKFLLATTDPQKLPVTILSRCLQFHLKNMEPERIVDHLKHVLEQEMVPFEEAALWLLGRAADGSMRDAMSLTDQAIAFGAGKVVETDVGSMLGAIDQSLVFDLLKALSEGQGQELLASVERLSQHAPDYVAALAEVLSVLHRIAIAQALPEAVDNSRGDRDKIMALAQCLPSEDVQLFYQTALLGRRDLPMSPEPRAGFEMVLLRMLAFRPQGVHQVPTEALPEPVATEPLPASDVAALGNVALESAAIEGAGVERIAPESPTIESAGLENAAATEVAPSLPETPVEQAVPSEVMPTGEPSAVAEAGVEAETAAPETLTSGELSEPVPATTAAEDTPPWPVEPNPEKKLELSVAAEASVTTEVNGSAQQNDGTEARSPTLSAQSDVKQQAAMANMQAQLAGEAVEAMPVAEPEPVVSSVKPAVPVVASKPERVVPNALPSVEKLALNEVSPENWIQLYLGLGVGGVLQSTVSNCVLVGVQANTLSFRLDAANSTLYDPAHQQRLSDLLSSYFGEPVIAVIEPGTVAEETPALFAARMRREQHARAMSDLQADPLVQQLLQHFDGVIDDATVTALEV